MYKNNETKPRLLFLRSTIRIYSWRTFVLETSTKKNKTVLQNSNSITNIRRLVRLQFFGTQTDGERRKYSLSNRLRSRTAHASRAHRNFTRHGANRITHFFDVTRPNGWFFFFEFFPVDISILPVRIDGLAYGNMRRRVGRYESFSFRFQQNALYNVYQSSLPVGSARYGTRSVRRFR